MADSYHIIDGKVVPYSGGRKCNDTDAWRDAAPLELKLQEQLSEYEHANAAQAAEIEALRAEVAEAREFRDKMANAIGNDQLRRFIEKHGEPVPLTIRMQEAEARAERLAEALRKLEEREQRDEALLRQALEALELRCGTHADERKKLIPALRERLGEGGAMIYVKETGNE